MGVPCARSCGRRCLWPQLREEVRGRSCGPQGPSRRSSRGHGVRCRETLSGTLGATAECCDGMRCAVRWGTTCANS